MLPNATRLAPVRSPSLAAHVNGTPHADADYPLSPAQSLLPARGMTLGSPDWLSPSYSLFALCSAWRFCRLFPSYNATQIFWGTLCR